MSFKVRKTQHRPWPITLVGQECQADGSVLEVTSRFIAWFKPFTEAEILDIRNEIFGAGSDEELKAARENRTLAKQAELDGEFFSRLLCGWEHVTDEDDQPLEFSPARAWALCAGPDGAIVRAALSDAVLQIRFGIAPAKNVATSPAPGPTPGAVEVVTSSTTT